MTILRKAVATVRGKMCSGKAAIAFCGILIASLLMSTYVRAQEAEAMQRFFNRTPSQYKPYAVALGQRLLKAGQMRIMVNGFLGYSESLDKPAQVEIVWQFPMKIRLTDAGSSQSFDMSNTTLKAPADKKLADTVEVLLQDSAEGLLFLRSTIGRTRHLGSDFKLAGADAKSAAIDIVQTTYSDVFRDEKPVIKTYWFDSQTKLLGFVGYQSASGEQVDVIVDDWRDVEGEKVPFLIERWVNGKLMMRLTLVSAKVTAATDDGMFGGN